jgi:hypothetical protein
MVLFYNVAQPQNIKASYSPFDQIDFLVKIPAGREIKQNSFRISGTLNITVTRANSDVTTIAPTDGICFNSYAGAHSLFRSFTTSVNDQTVENIAYYPRWVAMKEQAMKPESQLYSSSDAIVECKGLRLPNILTGVDKGTDKNNVYFSIKPLIAINKSNQNLPQSKFVQVRVMAQLASALESFYTTAVASNGTTTNITNIAYTVSDLQLSWYEQPQASAGDVVLNTCYLNKQSIVSNHTNLNIFAPNVYDAISVSFIRQADLNKVITDNNGCYFIRGIQRVEFTLNGTDSPISYPLTSYEDILVNYKKSLMAGEKHAFGFKNRNATFGLGCSFPTSVNDKLGVNIDIDDVVNMSTEQYDAYIYVNGYVTL